MTEDTQADTGKGLYFMPLGGSAEIGENFYLYAVDDAWIIVDCGVRFGDEATPGIDVIMPDPAFIEARRKKLLGIVLT
ncbi:MAG: MBL fold metallo-hydrolase, partial [Pseudomonadota bacterium]